MHAQGVKQWVCMSVVVVGMKIARSRVLGIRVCCKLNQSVDTLEFVHTSNCSKRLTRATNCAFSVQHATVHAQVQSWKGLKSALYYS